MVCKGLGVRRRPGVLPLPFTLLHPGLDVKQHIRYPFLALSVKVIDAVGFVALHAVAFKHHGDVLPLMQKRWRP